MGGQNLAMDKVKTKRQVMLLETQIQSHLQHHSAQIHILIGRKHDPAVKGGTGKLIHASTSNSDSRSSKGNQLYTNLTIVNHDVRRVQMGTQVPDLF